MPPNEDKKKNKCRGIADVSYMHRKYKEGQVVDLHS